VQSYTSQVKYRPTVIEEHTEYCESAAATHEYCNYSHAHNTKTLFAESQHCIHALFRIIHAIHSYSHYQMHCNFACLRLSLRCT